MIAQEKLKEQLLKIPSARLVSGGKEILMRCQYCEDSKNPNHAHMYICLGYNDEPQYYNCFKCHSSGLVTRNELLNWGIYDVDTLISTSNYNKKVLQLEKNRRFKDRDVYIIYNNFISDNDLSKVKLKYINNRLGTNLNYNDLLNNKIILNLKDLLTVNNIQNITRSQNIIDQLDESFIGFISQDNAFTNMRNLRPGKVDKLINKRYVNYNIFNKFNNKEKYYTIPTNIDLSYPKRIKLNIAEGPFDILSIYYNLRKQEKHSIYSSITGSGYLNILKHFINDMKLINLEVHVYIDNDINNNIIYKMKELLYVYQMPLYIHRNLKVGEKDFGVPINKIEEQTQLI